MLEGAGSLNWRRWSFFFPLGEAAPAKAVAEEKEQECKKSEEGQEDEEEELPCLEPCSQDI